MACVEEADFSGALLKLTSPDDVDEKLAVAVRCNQAFPSRLFGVCDASVKRAEAGSPLR